MLSDLGGFVPPRSPIVRPDVAGLPNASSPYLSDAGGLPLVQDGPHASLVSTPVLNHAFDGNMNNRGSAGAVWIGTPTYAGVGRVGVSSANAAFGVRWPGNTTWLSDPQFILDFWIRITGYPGGSVYYGVMGRRPSFGSQVWALVFNGDINGGDLGFDWRTSPSVGPPENSFYFPRDLFRLNGWTHVRISRTLDGYIHMFIDGRRLRSVASAPISSANAGEAYILSTNSLSAGLFSISSLMFYNNIGSGEDFAPNTG